MKHHKKKLSDALTTIGLSTVVLIGAAIIDFPRTAAMAFLMLIFASGTGFYHFIKSKGE